MTNRVIASVEARMGSSRLPGKVLADIGGQTALDLMFTRLQGSRRLDGVVLATSTCPQDDVLAEWAHARGVPCYRGSEDDVLGRVVEAQRMMGSDIVCELTGDCPLIDPEIVDWCIDTFLANTCDVVANCEGGGFPNGADVQVFPLALLAQVADTIVDPAVREHVSLHFYENPDKYRIIHLPAPRRYHAPDLRITLDYQEDLDLIRAVYDELAPRHGVCFGTQEIIALVAARADLAAINATCVQKARRP
jgi:spore coat polysaccharide biosynthesis protein SpsF